MTKNNLDSSNDTSQFIPHPKFELYKTVVYGLLRYGHWNAKEAMQITNQAWDEWKRMYDKNDDFF